MSNRDKRNIRSKWVGFVKKVDSFINLYLIDSSKKLEPKPMLQSKKNKWVDTYISFISLINISIYTLIDQWLIIMNREKYIISGQR